VPTALLWFRRDLRPTDHPALLAAVDAAGQDGNVVGVFVVDPRLWEPAGEPRRAFLLDCLDEVRTATGGALVLRRAIRSSTRSPRAGSSTPTAATCVGGCRS
jgi:deoxyribodipyrimidine photo-lyase